MTLPESQLTITPAATPEPPRPFNLKQVDRKALTAAVKDPQAWFDSLELGKKLVFNRRRHRLNMAAPGKWYMPDLKSMLYSMQAHLRGHLHGEKKYNPAFDASGAQHLDARTLEDQLAMIGERWELFLKSEAAVEAAAARAAETPGYLS